MRSPQPVPFSCRCFPAQDVSQTSRIAGLHVQGSVTVDKLREVLLLLAERLRVPKAFIVEEDELGVLHLPVASTHTDGLS